MSFVTLRSARPSGAGPGAGPTASSTAGAPSAPFRQSVFDEAFDVAARAMAAEQDKKPKEALDLYQEALGKFIAVMQEHRRSLDPRSERLIREKMAEFMTRAELMQILISTTEQSAGKKIAAPKPQPSQPSQPSQPYLQYNSSQTLQPSQPPQPSQSPLPQPYQQYNSSQTLPSESLLPPLQPQLPSELPPDQPVVSSSDPRFFSLQNSSFAAPSPSELQFRSLQPGSKDPYRPYATLPDNPKPEPPPPGSQNQWRLSGLFSSAMTAASNTVYYTASAIGQAAAVVAADTSTRLSASQPESPYVAPPPISFKRLTGPMPSPPPVYVEEEEDHFEQYFDDDGIPYYYNKATNETVWEKPASTAATATAATAAEENEEIQKKMDELDMLKNRVGLLVLGDDQSGGVASKPTALTISNSITNLAAGTQGEMRSVAPMKEQNVEKWRRELSWLLLPLQHIVVRESAVVTNAYGEEIERMENRPREDIAVFLPKLRELDDLSIQVLESFRDQKFISYESRSSDTSGKWWINRPILKPGGLTPKQREHIEKCISCIEYVYINAHYINSDILRTFDVPKKYLASLPWNATPAVGYELTSMFTPEEEVTCDQLMAKFKIQTQEEAFTLVEKLEKMKLIWTRKLESNPKKSISEAGRLAQLLVLIPAIRERFPGMRQTAVEVAHIAENLDIGKSGIEAYSRVLESRAASILSRLQDVMNAHNEMANLQK